MDREKIFYDIRHKRITSGSLSFSEDEVVATQLNVKDVQAVIVNEGLIAFRTGEIYYVVHPNDTGTFRTMQADWSEFFPPTP